MGNHSSNYVLSQPQLYPHPSLCEISYPIAFLINTASHHAPPQPRDLWFSSADDYDLGHNGGDLGNMGRRDESRAWGVSISVGRLQLIQDQRDFCGGEKRVEI